MRTKQIAVFLENRKGRLAEVTRLLAGEEINIRGFSLADMADLGVLRLIVNDPDHCLRVLADNDFAAQVTEVIAVEVEDKPGGLHRLLETLNANDINVEYMYVFAARKADRAIVVLKIDPAEDAVSVLSRNGIPVLSEEAMREI